MIVSSFLIRENRRTRWNTCPADGLHSSILNMNSVVQHPGRHFKAAKPCFLALFTINLLLLIIALTHTLNFNVTQADPKMNRFEPYSNDGTSPYRSSIVLRVPHYYQAISSELSYLIGVLTSSSRVSRLAHIRVTSERSRWLLPEVPVLRSNEFCLLIISYRKGERLMMASALETRSGAKNFAS